jgi:hypothetical protein
MYIKLGEGSIVLRADDFEAGTVVTVGPALNMHPNELMVAWENGAQHVIPAKDVVLTGAVIWQVMEDPMDPMEIFSGGS